MSTERRITPEDARAAADQLAAAMASGQQSVRVEIAGNPLLIEKTAEGGFTLRTPDNPAGARLFPAAGARPSAYPDDVPFAPGEPVMVSDNEGTTALMWWAPARPEELLAALHEDCGTEGWIQLEEGRPEGLDVHQYTFGRGEARRYLMRSAGMVSLIQKPAKPASTAS